MQQLLDLIAAPQLWFLSQSPYISMTVTGFVLAGMMTCAGFALARMGYKPLWAIVLLIPTLSVIGLWALAYRRFPREK